MTTNELEKEQLRLKTEILRAELRWSQTRVWQSITNVLAILTAIACGLAYEDER